MTKSYQAYGRALAMREVPPAGGAGTLSYMLADHLGGTAEVLDAAGATVAETKYWPYGATRTGGVAQTDKLYTGQQQEPGDAALGLYNYKARFYSTTVGRFVSADPTVPSARPVSLNRYAYVNNNPLTLTDPTGYDPPQQGSALPSADHQRQATTFFAQLSTAPSRSTRSASWPAMSRN